MLTAVFLFASLILVIHGQTTNNTDLLVPNYDNKEHKLKAFVIRRPLVLHCHITEKVDSELSWEKNGIEVKKVKELKSRYEIIDSENKFIITKTEASDVGNYSCTLDGTKMEFNVLAELAVRTPSNVVVPETEDLMIACEVVGSEPHIHWEIGNLTIDSSTELFKLEKNEDGVENAVLKVTDVTLGQRGEYTCVGSNILSNLNISTEAKDTTFVRVKSSMASLWPALGIAAQVLVLGVITIYAQKADKKLTNDEEEN